jgi:hypothetical protein
MRLFPIFALTTLAWWPARASAESSDGGGNPAPNTVRLAVTENGKRTEWVCTSERPEIDLRELRLNLGSLRCSPDDKRTRELAIKLPRQLRWQDGIAACPLPEPGTLDADVCATEPDASCRYLDLREYTGGELKRELRAKRASFTLEAWKAIGPIGLEARCGREVHLAGSLTANPSRQVKVQVSWDLIARARE